MLIDGKGLFENNFRNFIVPLVLLFSGTSEEYALDIVVSLPCAANLYWAVLAFLNSTLMP